MGDLRAASQPRSPGGTKPPLRSFAAACNFCFPCELVSADVTRTPRWTGLWRRRVPWYVAVPIVVFSALAGFLASVRAPVPERLASLHSAAPAAQPLVGGDQDWELGLPLLASKPGIHRTASSGEPPSLAVLPSSPGAAHPGDRFADQRGEASAASSEPERGADRLTSATGAPRREAARIRWAHRSKPHRRHRRHYHAFRGP